MERWVSERFRDGVVRRSPVEEVNETQITRVGERC
jgi:hypothetical protein